MRRCLLLVVLIGLSVPAFAELQQVSVGGELRIKGNYITNWINEPAPVQVYLPAALAPGRPLGDFLSGLPANGGLGIAGIYRFDKKGNSHKFIEYRTRLNVKADFTEGVSAFIELDDYGFWGEDFRANAWTGTDARAATGDDVEIYQAYIEAAEMYGIPLTLRVGRQELAFGSQWLVGPKDFGPNFVGRSFDALRLTYAVDAFRVDAFASKLAENTPIEEDGDVDFYGIYGSYLGIEDVTLDAYWLYLRDHRALNDTQRGIVGEWVEDLFGVDDYDGTDLHTLGLRAAGTWNAFDFELEAAYQFGDAGQTGFNFKPRLYGDDDAEYDVLGLNAEAGYTIDMAWHPRVALHYSFYEGEDNRDLSFWEWLNPFDLPEASVSFNRLFSNHMYSGFFDLQNDFSNGHVMMGMVTVHPTEQVHVHLDVIYFMADETFDWPVHFRLGRTRIPWAPLLPWWDTEGADDLGWQTDLVLTYNYSEDLMFMLHWCHLFGGEALSDGVYTSWNGLVYTGGVDDDDADFVTVETRIKF